MKREALILMITGVISVLVLTGCPSFFLATEQASIAVSAESIDLGLRKTTATVFVTNSGGGMLQWKATPSAEWLAVDPASGENNERSVTISLLADALPAGNPEGSVVFAAVNGKKNSVTVTVQVSELFAIVEGEAPTDGEPAEGDTPAEGDAPVEGDTPVEGEVVEGQIPAEGQILLEGEPVEGEYLFTSAAAGNRNNPPEADYESPTDEVEAEGESSEQPGNETPREVSEPDVIQKDGKYLYILNQYKGLVVVDMDTEEVLSEAPTYGFPRDLYVRNGRAYVLSASVYDYKVDGNLVSFDIQSKLYIVDVSDPTNVSLIKSFPLEGDFQDSRMVGDVLYAVSARYTWTYDYPESEGEAVPADSINKGATTASWVTSINCADPSNVNVVETLSLENFGSIIQATPKALFVAAPVGGYYWWSEMTRITYVDIADPAGDIAVRGAVEVRGQVADRFKMDASNDVLRVVSNTWASDTGGRQTLVTTVDLANPDEMAKLGELTIDKASGETVFATRFDGNRCYIITYLMRDPLFVVDLSNPAQPAVLGELEMPGWVTHIEPRGDRLFGLGVDDTAGRKVSMSLFNVADPADPQLLAKVVFGDDWAYSSAHWDVKALTVMDDMILVPYGGWTQESGGYERLQFISVNGDDLTARGYAEMTNSIRRSFRYGEKYFCVTWSDLTVIDGSNLDAPAITNRILYSENVRDYYEFDAENGVAVLAGQDYRHITIATTRGRDVFNPLDSVDVEIGNAWYAPSYISGTTLVLATTQYEQIPSDYYYYNYRYYYQVTFADCSDPQNIVVRTEKYDLSPYNYYWYGYYDYAMPERADAKSVAYYGYWGYSSDSMFVMDGKLYLQYYGDQHDVILGPLEAATQGLAEIDIASGIITKKYGLGFSNVASIRKATDSVFISSVRYLDNPTGNYYYSSIAYYLSEFVPQTGALSPAVNVPGSFVAYYPDKALVMLRDYQWITDPGTGYWSTETYYKTVTWTRGPVRKVDGELKLSFSGYTQDMPFEGGLYVVEQKYGGCYYCEYGYPMYDKADAVEYGSYLYKIALADDGTMTLSPGTHVTTSYASPLGSFNGDCYLSMGPAVAHYDFETEVPGLLSLTETGTWIGQASQGAGGVYVVAGQYGIVDIP